MTRADLGVSIGTRIRCDRGLLLGGRIVAAAIT